MDHDPDCAGPGIPCENPACPYSIIRRPVKTVHGLVCPHCRQPVATVEDDKAGGLLFQCPECGNRWAWSAQKPH
jgi:hypothetical protein